MNASAHAHATALPPLLAQGERRLSAEQIYRGCSMPSSNSAWPLAAP